MLLSALLVTNISACHDTHHDNSTEHITKENLDILESNVGNSDHQVDTPINAPLATEQAVCSSSSIYEIRNTYFYEKINNNPYDTWLESKKAEGTLSEKELYKSWLDFWGDELSFTIKSGKTLFSNENDYLAWKTNLEQWLELTQENLRIEMNNMVVPSSLAQARLIHHAGEIIRQKVIDTKYFLYKIECDKATLVDSSAYEFTVEWATNSNP